MPKKLRLFSVLLSATVLCAAIPLSVQQWKKTAEHAYTWEKRGGFAYIISYNGMQTDWTFPETLGGLPVIGIEERAFSGNETVHTLCLPVSLRSIGAYAFYGCPNLCNVQMHCTLQTVGDYAFSQCPCLAEMEINAETIGEGTCSGMTGLRRVRLNRIVTIGEAAFADCPLLHTVILPNTLQTVGKEAFYNDPSLHTVTIPKKTKLGPHAFGYRCGSHILDSVPVEDFDMNRE